MFLWQDVTSTTFHDTIPSSLMPAFTRMSRYNVTKLLKFMYFLLQILSRKYWLPSALKFHDSENNVNAGSVIASIHNIRVYIELVLARMFGKTAFQAPTLVINSPLLEYVHTNELFIYNVFAFSYVLQSLYTCIRIGRLSTVSPYMQTGIEKKDTSAPSKNILWHYHNYIHTHTF